VPRSRSQSRRIVAKKGLSRRAQKVDPSYPQQSAFCWMGIVDNLAARSAAMLPNTKTKKQTKTKKEVPGENMSQRF
jgi:hypothetical protein